MNEQVSRLAVCRRPINYRISSHFGETGETLISGLRRKGITLRTLMLAVTSLWPQKVVCRSHVYSARTKLMQIADQARDLVYNFPFQNGSSTSGFLNKLTVSGKFPSMFFGLSSAISFSKNELYRHLLQLCPKELISVQWTSKLVTARNKAHNLHDHYLTEPGNTGSLSTYVSK